MADTTEKAEKPAEAVYPQERLIEYAEEYLGVQPSVVAGALLGLRKQNFTVTEAKKAVAEQQKGTVDYAAVAGENEEEG